MSSKIQITAAVLLSVLGLAIGVGARQYIQSRSLTPEQALAAAFDSMINAKTVAFTADILVEQTPNDAAVPGAMRSSPVKIHMSGSGDSTDIANPKSTVNLSFALPEEMGSGAVDLESRFFKNTLYINLKKMPTFFVDFTPILGTWIKTDLKELTKQIGQEVADPKIDPVAIAKFRQDLKAAKILKINKTYEDEAVGEEAAGHYGWMIDKEALLAFVPTYEAFVVSTGAIDKMAFDKEMEDALAKLKAMPAEEYPSGDIWITKTAPRFAKISYEKTFPPAFEGNFSSSGAHIAISMSFTDIDKPVSILEPETSITFQEAYAKMTEKTERQFAQARNTQRSANVNAVLNAIGQNMADNRGTFNCKSGDLPKTATVMASKKGYNIAPCIIPEYLPSMPFDPSDLSADYMSTSDYFTGYTVMQTGGSTGRVTVAAPEAELGEVISVTR